MPDKAASFRPNRPIRVQSQNQNQPKRAIDLNVTKTQKDLSTRFSYVTKARANVWLVVAVVLFIFGLLFSIFYVTKDSSQEDTYNFGGAAFFGDTSLISSPVAAPLITGPGQVKLGKETSFTFQVAATTQVPSIIEGQWGDGTTFAKCCFSINGTTSIDLTHTYTAPGAFQISVRTRTSSGNQVSSETTSPVQVIQ